MSIKKLALLAFAALSISAAQAANIVINGDFESSLTGWSTFTHSDGNVGTGVQSDAPYSGSSYFFGYDNEGGGSLQQILATSVGGIYQISFAFDTSGSVPPNALSVSVGDLNQALALTQNSWNVFNGSFTATSATTTLSFLFATVPGTGTIFVDAVNVEQSGAVPEPGSMALVGLGLAAIAFLAAPARRRV